MDKDLYRIERLDGDWTVRGEDGRLYYTDKDGQILPDADVASETAS